MRSAKQQKQTLDPKKISGRCGRLMCCLRYEDQTYRELKKNLPHRKTRVGTAEGPGIVLDGKILTQLVLVALEHDNRQIAVPVEELLDPETCPRPWEEVAPPPQTKRNPKKRSRNRSGSKKNEGKDSTEKQSSSQAQGSDGGEGSKKKKRRRRRRRRKGGHSEGGSENNSGGNSEGGDGSE